MIKRITQWFEFKVLTATYFAHFKKLEEGLHRMQRKDRFAHASKFIDVYGPASLLIFLHPKTSAVEFCNDSKLFKVDSPSAIFVPAYHLIEFYVQPGVTKWTALIANKSNPFLMPNQPCLKVDWDGKTFPDTFEKIASFLMTSTGKVEISFPRKISELSLNVKNFIDRNYCSDLHINEVAEALEVSRVILSRDFRRCFGISPVQYRHRLRVFHAVQLLQEGSSVQEAMLASGFVHHGQFTSHFKKFLNAKPSQYLPI